MAPHQPRKRAIQHTLARREAPRKSLRAADTMSVNAGNLAKLGGFHAAGRSEHFE